MPEAITPLLQHALIKQPCTDPDCELHNPEVGWEEGTVDQGDLAFYLAGANWMWLNFNCVHPDPVMRDLLRKMEALAKTPNPGPVTLRLKTDDQTFNPEEPDAQEEADPS